MPTYEYQCENCGRQFTLSQSISEHDKKETICPECMSDKVTQPISHFIEGSAGRGSPARKEPQQLLQCGL